MSIFDILYDFQEITFVTLMNVPRRICYFLSVLQEKINFLFGLNFLLAIVVVSQVVGVIKTFNYKITQLLISCRTIFHFRILKIPRQCIKNVPWFVFQGKMTIGAYLNNFQADDLWIALLANYFDLVSHVKIYFVHITTLLA